MTTNSYALPVHILPDLEEARGLLTACNHYSAALDKLDADLETARLAQSEAQGRRAELITARALEVESSKVKAYATKLEKAAAEATSVASEIEAIEIAHKALTDKLLATEEELRAFSDFRAAQLTAAHAAAAAQGVIGELAEAVRPLLPVILKMAALQDATLSPQLGFVLGELRIPGDGMNADLLTGNLADLPGEPVMVRSAWKAIPELVELHQVASESQRAARDLRSYVPRARRMQAATPYVRRGYSMDGEATRVAKAAREQAVATAEPNTAPAPRTAARTLGPDDRRDLLQQKASRTGSSKPSAEIVDGNVAAGLLNNLMRD